MQAYKYIILPLLLIGSTSSLLVGNTDSDKFKPTFFDKIANRIENSRLFNRISFETLEKVNKGLLALAVGGATYLAYQTYGLYKSGKELRQSIKKLGKSIKATKKAIKNKKRELEIEAYQNAIAEQRDELLEAKRIIAKQQELITEDQKMWAKQREPYWNRISNYFWKK